MNGALEKAERALEQASSIPLVFRTITRWFVFRSTTTTRVDTNYI